MGSYQAAVKRIVEAETPERFCSALKWCRWLLKAGLSNEEVFTEELKLALHERVNSRLQSFKVSKGVELSGANVAIYTDSSALVMFLDFIARAAHGENILRQIDYILDILKSCTQRPRGGIISCDEAIELLKLAESKYAAISASTYWRELDIYLINRSHICYDSFLLTFKNTYTGLWLNKWIIFCLSPKAQMLECNKYYVFMHEIGHVLYNAVTERTASLPNLLREIAFVLGMQEIAEQKPDEFFADIFSAAALHNTGYSEYNPFKPVIPIAFYELLDLYIKSIVFQVEENNREVSHRLVIH